MTELLEFKKDYPNVSCFSCRKSYEEQERLPPCDVQGRCRYTRDEEEPPTEKLSGYSALAWKLWNVKEALGIEAVQDKLRRYTETERELLYELLFHIEAEAWRLGLKQDNTFLLGGK